MAQDCSIISKANDILPDRLCSPVTVDWEISYRGVNDGGTPVLIFIDWDDGSTDVVAAVNTNPDPLVREWSATANHTYTSDDDLCNYHPIATLVVNGELCTSSSQEQIVTVWDNDDSNGGELFIDPLIYPICVGNSANARFQDNTQFNCVPPQENDVPNVSTRWIQWIYGTDITMTGTPVTIDGNPVAFPYSGSIITLPGPVTGSGIFSQVMNVDNDKLVGQYFQVTLRYWNFCNPYDDPNIPGPPADPVDGDHPPVTTTARILIVADPDATIAIVPPLCEDTDPFNLIAASGGGVWSGDGIIDPVAGTFSPQTAGMGDHLVRYDITDGNNCSDWDTIMIHVYPSPDATITPVDPLCIYSPTVDLETASSSGTWSGDGITNSTTGIFDPADAGVGSHLISYESNPDVNGCRGSDNIVIEVMDIPEAEFISEDSSWCNQADNSSTALVLIEGNQDLDYDLIWDNNGTIDTIFNINSDFVLLNLDNLVGKNTYRLLKIIEHFGTVSCESILDDEIIIEVHDAPLIDLKTDPDGICNPVDALFNTVEGYEEYSWDFGDGGTLKTDTSFAGHTFYYFGKSDTSYHVKLVAKTEDGCIDSISTDIQVYPRPKADFFVSPQTQSYPDTTVSLTNLSSQGDYSYLWDFGDGETSDIRQPLEHHYAILGNLEISLTIFSEFCSDSIRKQITILPPPPIASFNPDTAGCPPLVVSFRNDSRYGESYIWDFDDGTFSTEKDPVHVFYQPKTHNVTLRVTGLGGQDETTHLVTVYTYPQALFSAYPTEARDVSQLFRFLNGSLNAIDYRWDFGDGEQSNDENPSHVYGREGEFDVSLYVWSENGCPDTLTLEKYIKVTAGQGEIAYPNVFRWNGSGPTGGWWTEGTIDNTIFHPYFYNVVDYELYIYSRWGELIYESHDIHKGWDGYLPSGRKANQGVYVFRAVVTYVNGKTEVVIGDVTFLH